MSCLEYGHPFYFGAAISHLDCLDALQHQATGICHRTIPSIESRQHAAAVTGLTYRLLDEGHGFLFLNSVVTTVTRISSRLYLSSRLSGYCLTLPGHLD